MKSLTLITLALTAFILSVSAQSIKKKGFVVLQNGDTLYGWVNYKNWKQNPSSVGFFKDAETTATNYSINDLQVVSITGLDEYIKTIITKDDRPVKIQDMLPAEVNMTVTDTVLLRKLIVGDKYELYELYDTKYHFFIKEANKPLQELIFKVIHNVDNTFTNQKTFIQQLKVLLANTETPLSLLKKIDYAEYKEKDLKNVVTEMNNLSGHVLYATASDSKKILFAFFAGAGVGYSSIKFSGSHGVFSSLRFSGGFVPKISVGVDISSVRNLQDVVLRAELNYTTASYKGRRTRLAAPGSPLVNTTTYEVKQANISPSVSVLYNFIRKESARVYVGAGVSYNFSTYSKNKYASGNETNGYKEEDPYLNYPSLWLSFQGKLGVKINNRWEAGVTAQLIGSFTNYSLFSFTPNTYTAHFIYHFK